MSTTYWLRAINGNIVRKITLQVCETGHAQGVIRSSQHSEETQEATIIAARRIDAERPQATSAKLEECSNV